MTVYLDFEKPVADLEIKVKELRLLEKRGGSADISEEIDRLEMKAQHTLKDIYANLTAAQKTKVARHPERPHFKDYIREAFTEFVPLAGDRAFGEDQAVIGGIAKFRGRHVMVIGHEKGADLDTRLKHNFGMGKPEGYRKAVRLMKMANKFSLPLITLIDTPGAYPGVGAEERGQAEAIARATQACFAMETPLISVIIGEGGSGGAVSLATGDRVIMPEYSMYSVISPEGCASILWRDAKKSDEAAAALKLTPKDLLKLKIIDVIVPEPAGGAHRAPKELIEKIGDAIETALSELAGSSPQTLKQKRREKYMALTQ